MRTLQRQHPADRRQAAEADARGGQEAALERKASGETFPDIARSYAVSRLHLAVEVIVGSLLRLMIDFRAEHST